MEDLQTAHGEACRADAPKVSDEELAEEEGHHPALLTEWGRMTVTWWSHKIRGLHRNDFIMAAKTDARYGGQEAAPAFSAGTPFTLARFRAQRPAADGHQPVQDIRRALGRVLLEGADKGVDQQHSRDEAGVRPLRDRHEDRRRQQDVDQGAGELVQEHPRDAGRARDRALGP